MFYADRNFVHFSLDKRDIEGEVSENYLERYNRMYPGYVVQDSFHMVPAPGTRTVNLQHLIEVLRSSDKQLWEDNRWMFDGEMRFLDGQPIAGNKVCFTSIHRSGNTFMRQYLEI